MASYQQLTALGNVTRDIELRYLAKGTAVARVSIAINRKWKSESGEQKEEVTFLDLDVFGKQAEILSQYVRKGDPLFVTARLRNESWEDKQTGQKRSKLAVVLESFQLLSGRRDGAAQAAPRAPSASRPNLSPTGTKPDTSGDRPPHQDDDVCF